MKNTLLKILILLIGLTVPGIAQVSLRPVFSDKDGKVSEPSNFWTANAVDISTGLNLGTSALLDVGTTAGTVAAGDDARLSNNIRTNVSSQDINGSGHVQLSLLSSNSDNSATFMLRTTGEVSIINTYLPWAEPMEYVFPSGYGTENVSTREWVRGSITSKTANFTLARFDENAWIRVNSGTDVTCEIPLNSTTPIPIGAEFDIIQVGDGQVIFAGETGGVTINVEVDFLKKTRGKFSGVTLKKVGTNEWDLIGGLEEDLL